jgi:flavin-binding protein dodecin
MKLCCRCNARQHPATQRWCDHCSDERRRLRSGAVTVEQVNLEVAERLVDAHLRGPGDRQALVEAIARALHRAQKQAAAVACLTCAMEKAQREDGTAFGAGAVLF